MNLLDSVEGMERLIVHFELLLLKWRVKIKKLTTQDVRWNVVDVFGKGRGEGKWRTVPWV